MPDVFLLVKAAAIGALVAAAVQWLGASVAQRLGRNSPLWSSAGWYRAGWSWAIGAGVIVASGVTDEWPHWPALEDRARFLTMIVPLTILVETVAASVHSRLASWGLRLGLAAVVTPILLHNTVYLADLNGPGSAEWSRSTAAMILCALAGLLAALWAALSGLQARTSIQTVQWLLALDALATAVTVMLSGYFRAGLLGLGVAGAIAGATLGSYVSPRQTPADGGLGLSVISVFSVALMGRFFGALSTSQMLCLVVAPLLAWTVELRPLQSAFARWRTCARVACVLIPLVVVVVVAQRKFTEASAARSRTSPPTMAPTDRAK